MTPVNDLKKTMKYVNGLNIHPSARIIMIHIAQYGVLTEAVEDMVHDIDISKRTIQRQLQILEEKGLVAVKRNFVDGRISPNTYYLVNFPEKE